MWELLFSDRLRLPFLYLTLTFTTLTPPPFSNPGLYPNARVLWGNDILDWDLDFGRGFGVPGQSAAYCCAWIFLPLFLFHDIW